MQKLANLQKKTTNVNFTDIRTLTNNDNTLFYILCLIYFILFFFYFNIFHYYNASNEFWHLRLMRFDICSKNWHFDICGRRVMTFAVNQILTFDICGNLWHLRLTCYDICGNYDICGWRVMTFEGIMTFAVDVLWHLREFWHLRLTCYDICGHFDISGRFWHLRALQPPLKLDLLCFFSTEGMEGIGRFLKFRVSKWHFSHIKCNCRVSGRVTYVYWLHLSLTFLHFILRSTLGGGGAWPLMPHSLHTQLSMLVSYWKKRKWGINVLNSIYILKQFVLVDFSRKMGFLFHGTHFVKLTEVNIHDSQG